MAVYIVGFMSGGCQARVLTISPSGEDFIMEYLSSFLGFCTAQGFRKEEA